MASATDESPDVQVRLEDQLEINEFGRLNGRKHEQQEDVAEIDKRVTDLENAEEAVLLADESIAGSIKLLVGEAFCDWDSGAAAEYVQEELSREKAAKETLLASIASIVARQDALKKKLYARFGRSINLEDAPGAAPSR